MGVIIDTSVVLGWLERKTPATVVVVSELSTPPMVHLVSLGELHEGVVRSLLGGAIDRTLRRLTCDFASTHLKRPDPGSEMNVECFGWVSATTSRKLSHNDKWIVAASIVGGHRLLTEDQRIHEQVMGNSSLESIVSDNGWSTPKVTLVG